VSASKIVTLVRAHPIRLQLQVPSEDAVEIKTGLKVLARVESHGTREFEGKITALNPSIDPNSRSMMAEAKFDNPKMELLPGMFAIARIMLPREAEAVMVPRDAVLVDPTLDAVEVFVIEDGRAHIRIVAVEESEASVMRVLSGVSAGEVVATNALQQLYDGANVKVQ
jgi:membrane fusion protein (multidrug efflux system)